MKKLLAAGLTAGLLAAAAPPATAHPNHHYLGSCEFAVVNDTTPGGQLGGPTTWNGVAAVVVVATDTGNPPIPPLPDRTAPISVDCDLYVNHVYRGTLVIASGTGVAVGVVQVAFSADPFDFVELCTEVVVGGEPHSHCDQVTTQTVPPPLIELGHIVVDPVLDGTIDPLLCPLLITVYPLVPGIGPDGDITVLGDKVHDCPPYDPGGRQWHKYFPYVMTTLV